MLNFIKAYLIVLCMFLFSFCLFSCASIVKSGPQSISFNSDPSGAILSVYDMNNDKEIINATTPHTATLKRGAGYFKKAKYQVKVSKQGYNEKEMVIEGKANGWYIGGNILFGGLIGWFIVDPSTGSMWTLQPENVDIELPINQSSVLKEEGGLTIVLSKIENIPQNIRGHLKPVVLK
jgi:hypothetical protein